MKKHFIFALGGFLALALGSCVDLNQEPRSFITEEEFITLPQNIATVQKGVTGLYSNLWGGNYGYGCRMLRINASADQMFSNPTKPLQYMVDLQPSIGLNKGDDWNTPWSGFYSVVTNANKIINGTPLPTEPAELAKYQAVLGEAYFLRSLAYFHLVRLFGDVPMILNQVEGTALNVQRVPVADIYEKVILPDALKAIEWLPLVSRGTQQAGDAGTPSKWAAKLMLSDIYMTMAGWPLKKGASHYAMAAAMAQDVIQNSGLTLEPTYGALWQETGKYSIKEHIFAIYCWGGNPNRYSQYGTSFYPTSFVNPPTKNTGGWADYYGDPTYFANYPEGARKQFNYMTSWYEGTVAKNTLVTWQTSANIQAPCIAKYQKYNNGNPAASAQSLGLIPVYRFADALLFYAEASVAATGSVDALASECLRRVQVRAGSAVTTANDAATFSKAVFDEYGYEMFVEGAKRWFQVQRLEKLGDIKPAAVWNASFFKANGHYWFPIGSAQMNLTPSWPNNAGY